MFRWFLTRVNPLLDADGKIIRWVGINTDVDDRRRHARTLERLSDIGRTISADLELQKIVQAVTDAATELSGTQFRAFFYNLINDAGRGVHALHDLRRAARALREVPTRGTRPHSRQPSLVRKRC